MDSCKCFVEYNCEMLCPYGSQLDPTQFCSCIEQDAYDTLMKKSPMQNDECNEDYWGPPPPPKEPECALTKDECPNDNFTVNKKNCECECDLVCIATMTFDSETCTCKPIFVEPSKDFTCDWEGNK